MLITPFYAAVLGLLFLVLSVRTLRLRRALGIPVGNAGNPLMIRSMRAHANFAEYTPYSLLLIFLFELGGGFHWLINGLCICLLLGRFSHAYGISCDVEDYRFRIFGMAMTFTAFVGASIGLIAIYVSSLVKVM